MEEGGLGDDGALEALRGDDDGARSLGLLNELGLRGAVLHDLRRRMRRCITCALGVTQVPQVMALECV